jgi:hypothetical protein
MGTGIIAFTQVALKIKMKGSHMPKKILNMSALLLIAHRRRPRRRGKPQ